MGISHLAGLFVGPMDRILVTIVISCALCGFGNACFVRSLCHMSVQPFLTILYLERVQCTRYCDIALSIVRSSTLY